VKEALDMKYKAEIAMRCDAGHGECSWWDDRRQKMLFMDCIGKRLFAYDPETGGSREYKLPFNPEAVIGCEDGGYVATSENAVYKLDDDFNVVEKLRDVDHGKPTDRFNDCKCGPDGAFWVGSMGTQGEPEEGKLYRYTPEGELAVAIDKVGISNGFCWTSDLKTMFYTDTIHGEVYAFDYDAETSALSNRRVIFHDTSVQPDGMTIDDQDTIWLALWESSKVVHIDPKTGEILDEVEVEGANLTSSACFGGRNYDILFITTSRLIYKEGDLEKWPNAGSLFMVKTGAKGSQLFRGKF